MLYQGVPSIVPSNTMVAMATFESSKIAKVDSTNSSGKSRERSISCTIHSGCRCLSGQWSMVVIAALSGEVTALVGLYLRFSRGFWKGICTQRPSMGAQSELKLTVSQQRSLGGLSHLHGVWPRILLHIKMYSQ